MRGIAAKSAIFGACLLAAACTTQYRNHGYVPIEEDLAQLTVGVDTRDSVAEAVGTPSASGVLDSSGYYYIRTRVRHYGARRPQVIDRQLVAITFDQRGVVRNIERFSLEDGVAVPISRRVTDTGIQDNSILRQILGNFGQFSADDFLGG